MDISQTTAPKSDQQNFDDYIGGPKTVTVSEVRPGTSEQPVEVHLVEFPGRPYKPSKTQRRVLVAAWGAESAPWAGRRMTLYGDPSVKFGGQTVGGIKISHLSHIEKRLLLNLTVTKGKREKHTVEPLPDAPAAPTEADVTARIAACEDQGELRDLWNQWPDLHPEITERVAALKEAAQAKVTDAP